MMTPAYRVMYVQVKGSQNWRYATGEVYVKFLGPTEFAEFAGPKPIVFSSKETAERLARAMTDSQEIRRVALREELSIQMFDGAGKERPHDA